MRKQWNRILSWLLVLTLLLSAGILPAAAVTDAEDDSCDIPVSGMTATAGNSQSGEGPERVLDGQSGTLWHTLWSGSDRSTHWITLNLGGRYAVDGLRYLPRQSGPNGVITAYEIWASDGGEEFVKIASGNWEQNTAWKLASFTPYYMTQIKLVVLDASDDGFGEYASAAEIRVTKADIDEPYTLSAFTDESHGGWQIAANSGTGTMTFADNQMELWGKGATGNTAYYDASSPEIADGYVQATITPVTGSRFALLYRFTDKDHYTGVSYDNGWGWCGNDGNKWGNLTQDAAYTPQAGVPFTLRLEYSGSAVKVLVNGTQVAHGEITDSAISQDAGRIGFRLWGYGDDSADTRGHIKVSAIETGVIGAQELPEPEPEVPVEPVDETDADGNYLVTFTDEARRGELALQSGDGTVTFQDGQNENGYAIVAKEDNAETKAIFVVGRSPAVENGFLQADVTNLSGGRLGLIFRAKDNGDYVGVVYDVGTWYITKNGNNQASFSGGSWAKNAKKTIRVDFAGTKVTVTIDGSRVFSDNVPTLAGTGAGKVGAVVWGYSTGDNQGKAKLDNIVVGSRVAVELTPEEQSFTYAQAGQSDILVTMGETVAQNALTAVKIGDTTLTKDTDYTVSDRTVTLSKSLITEAVKEAGGLEFTFVFADGYEAASRVVVQAKPQETQVTYVRDFTTDPTQGENPMAVVSGSANLSYDADKDALIIRNASNAFLVDQAAPQLKNCDVEFTFNLTTDSGSFAALARYDSGSYVSVGPSSSAGIAWGAASNTGSMSFPNYEDGNQMFGNRTVPYKVRVRFLEKTAVVWVDNYEMWSGPVDCLGGSTGLPGIIVKGATMELLDFRVTSVEIPVAEETTGAEHEIASDEMTVTMDESFPRVISYELGNKTMQGQEIPYYVVELNNQEYVPTVTSEFTANSATYHLTMNVSATETVTFDAVFTVTDNVLQMKLQNIDDSQYHLYHINFPVHSLVSVASTEDGAELRAANYSTSEVRQDLTTQPASDMYESASIVVLSTDELAASINNESYNGHRGSSYQTMRNGDHTTTGLWSTGFAYRGLDDEIMFSEPWVKVAITGDRNGDNKVDYQDGAIARRDDCQKDGEVADVYGYDVVMGSYNTIAMDVGSAAQYPFLRILDNIKKLSLGIDNFPQTVIIKGYNGQGHDSNNNDFTNYNQAAGGLADFLTLLEKSEDYNTKIGIHINETETYPESATYGRLATSLTGWPWYDVARLIHHDNDSLDTSAEGLAARLTQLNQDTQGMLDLIYVDVYHKTRWTMYSLVDRINSMGIAMATEYPSAVDQHSVWAHHVGAHVTQDSVTGNLIRFVNNQYQDIFGSSSLFRGTSRVSGINGWQNASDYNGSLEHFYTSVLPNRFLVQYPIMIWENANEVVLGEEKNVVTKLENGVNVITLDGHEVARGNKIFLPFTVDGEEKIYHWNDATGSTTWTLPETFAGETQVKVFKLSDQGRTDMTTVNVQNGQVTISAQAKTPYVIYKGSSNVTETGSLTSYNWGEGGLVKDPGFDSFTPGYGWTVENAQFWDNDHENTYLVMNGTADGSATQTISGLTPGATYQASVWAEVSGKTAAIAVLDGTETLASNYMTESNVVYGIHHTDKYQRYLQRMWVEFTAPADGEVTLSLTGTSGTADGSYVHFDDVRIVAHTPSDLNGHDFYEDFENVTEGYGPFVSTESDTSHLAETNAPYTFDTIDGKYSLKTRAGDYFRTLPHTLRLQPNTKYTLGLEYISGSAGNVFTLAVKSDKAAAAGDTDAAVVASQVCVGAANWGENAPVTLTFTTGDYDDYYVDITKAGSISEYSIDNFYVDEVHEASKASLQALYETCEALTEADYTAESWNALAGAMANAEKVLDAANPTQEAVQAAQDALEQAKNALVAYAKDADLARLQTVIDEMNAVSSEHYAQDDAWTAFQAKIDEAEALAEAEKVTVPQIDDMIQALRDAKAALHSLVDKTELQALYDFCAAIPQNDIMDGNEAVTFLRVRTEAETVLKDETASQAAVDEAEAALSAAYEKIVPKRTTNEGHVDAAIVTELAGKLAEAKAVADPDDDLLAAIAQAEAATAAMATWKSVVEAIQALTDAMPDTPAHTHTLTHVEAKDATCSKPGNVEYWKCNECDKNFADAEGKEELATVTTPIDPNNHNLKLVGYEAATIFTPGYTGDWVCQDCGKTVKKGEVIPRIGSGIILPVNPGTPSYELPFVDVPEGEWYYESVYYAWDAGLIDGTSATTFRPDNTLTVAEAIKLAAALHQLENDGKVTLKNGKTNWYDTYVAYAVKEGIIESKYQSYTQAQMNAPAKRSEFVHILHGALDDYKAINAIGDNAIPDVKTGDTYAAEIYDFYRAGILTGSNAEGTFHPESSIKRSEVAAILIRMYDESMRLYKTL